MLFSCSFGFVCLFCVGLKDVALLVLWFCSCLFRVGSIETLFFYFYGFGVSALLF